MVSEQERIEGLLGRIRLAKGLVDVRTTLGDCKCDPSVGMECEPCFIHEVLGDAGREIDNFLLER